MAVTFAGFVWGKLRYDLIALTALGAGAAMGIVPVDAMVSGLSNELIWIIASALLLSAAIARSGVIERGLAPSLSRLQSPRLQMPLFTGLVIGPGGHKFSDYCKLGLPLSVLVSIAATPLILWPWPAS